MEGAVPRSCDRRRVLWGLAALIALTFPVQAGQREQDWGQNLARLLGGAAQISEPPPADAFGAQRAVVLSTSALRARRLKFEDPATAERFATRALLRPDRPWLIERRGSQVALVDGPALVKGLRPIRDAVWEVLTAPPTSDFSALSTTPGSILAAGTCEAGAWTELELPAAEGIWFVQLQGEAAAAIELVLTDGTRSWTNPPLLLNQPLLAPAGQPLRVRVRSRLPRALPWLVSALLARPRDALTLGANQRGITDRIDPQSGILPLSLHDLTPAQDFALFAARARGKDPGALCAALVDEEMQILERTPHRDGAATLVIPPRRRWQAFVGGLPPGEGYDVSFTPITPRARLDERGQAEGRLEGQEEAFYLLRPQQPGILRVKLSGADGADLDLTVHGSDGSVRRTLSPDANEEVALNARAHTDYLLRVAPGRAGAQRGAFKLACAPLQLGRLASDGAGAPHTWTILIGISSYGDQRNNLQHGRGDALTQLQALVSHGLAEPDRTVVLLDEEATRDTILRAVETVAQRADPDDLLVFHYSGHGCQLPDQRGPGADERDGLDEALISHEAGGALRDEELRSALDAIPTARQLVVLDCCFSGGFAVDLDRPGRFVICASQESQVSLESWQLKGGLLTATFAEGLGGLADLNRDGTLTLRELAAWLQKDIPLRCLRCFLVLLPGDQTCPDCKQPRFGAGPPPQVPVVVDRWQEDLVLSRPTRKRN